MNHDSPLTGAYWVEPGLFLAGEHPGLGNNAEVAACVDVLHDAGIRVFIDLTDDDETAELADYVHIMQQRYPAASIVRHHVPILDMHTPTDEQMAHILATIDDALSDHLPIYVHCWGGIGRTGTVVGCYLVEHGRSGSEAMSQIQVLRERTRDARYPAPTTAVQREMVLGWKLG